MFHQLHFHSYRIPIPNPQQNFIKKLTILFFFTPEEALAMEESTMLIFQKSCKFPTIDMLPSEQKSRNDRGTTCVNW